MTDGRQEMGQAERIQKGAAARILIIGCGCVGIELARQMRGEGVLIWGMRREAHLLPDFIQPLAGRIDGCGEIPPFPEDLDFVVVAVSSDSRTEESYRKTYVDTARSLVMLLKDPIKRPRRLFWVSSTGVYGQRNGEWVDEESETKPVTSTGRLLLEAERIVLESLVPSTVIRFSGIYGPERVRLLRRVANGLEPINKTIDEFTNRIHRDDCAGVIKFLMSLAEPGPLYLASDNEPVERSKVVRWLANELEREVPFDASSSFAGTSAAPFGKRCRNSKLRVSGYQFRYPSFREGYRQVIRELSDFGKL